jgi:hypothetical protein
MSPRGPVNWTWQWGLIAVIGAAGLAFADVPQRIPAARAHAPLAAAAVAHPHPGGTLRPLQVPRVRLVSPPRTPATVSRHPVARATSLGGANAYDARKGAAISGSLVHRPRGVAGGR